MKLLILVLSYNDDGVFTEFMRTQQNTWGKSHHSNINVIYYYGNDGLFWNVQHELKVKCTDDYDMMHWKFKLALDAIDYHKYDFIFRTNSCSYIVKERILKVCESLPKTNCYTGYHNGSYISGAGIFFTPDVLDILKDELTPTPHGAEDVLIGSILDGRVPMIADNTRTDATVEGFNTFEGYHFRAKTSNDINDRWRDIESLKRLHFYFK